MTNPKTKIERKKADIAKTEAKMAELKDKLNKQRQELIQLENEEIIALFRREKYNEDTFKALLRSQGTDNSVSDTCDSVQYENNMHEPGREGYASDPAQA